MAFGLLSAVSEAVIPSLQNACVALGEYVPTLSWVSQGIVAATAYVALGWLTESRAPTMPAVLAATVFLGLAEPAAAESVEEVVAAGVEPLPSLNAPAMESVGAAIPDTAVANKALVVAPPEAVLSQLNCSPWIPELFLYPLIANLCSPSEEYQHQGTALGVTALFNLLSPEEINAFYQEAVTFAGPLQPIFEQMKKLNLRIRDLERELRDNPNNLSLRREHTQSLKRLTEEEARLRKLTHRQYSFSAKLQVLVSFIFEWQGAVAYRRPYDCLLADKQTEPLSLQLQSGERVSATSLRGLFNQLWSRSTLQREHFGLQTVKAYAKQLPALLQDGRLYYLESINHCMLIQRQGKWFILFDPHQGVFKDTNIEKLLNNIEYLRTTGSIKDSLLTLSLAAVPSTLVPLPAHFKIPRMLAPPVLMNWVVRAITHNNKALLHHTLSAAPQLASPYLLMMAAYHNHFEVAEMLRRDYALAVDSDMLTTAIEYNHIYFVRSIMESPYFQDIDWNVGQSAPGSVGAYLSLALEKRHMNIFKLLVVDPRVNVNAVNGEDSPLKIAVQQGNLRALDLLFARPDLVAEVSVNLEQYGLSLPLTLPVLQFAEEIKALPVVLQCLRDGLARRQEALSLLAALSVGQGTSQNETCTLYC